MAASIALSAASPALRLLQHPKRLYFAKLHPHRSRRKLPAISNCTTNPTSDFESTPQGIQPSDDDTPQPSPAFPLEKRWPSVIEYRPRTSIQRPDPPNYEIGWKRTKEINNEKPKGFMIADFLEKLETLMGRQYGSADLLAKVGEIVTERAREEAEVLREGGEVEERLITELYRVLRLMEMDLEMVRAAVKEETLAERIEKAKARCRQAILVALSF